MTNVAAICNRIRYLVAEHGGSNELAEAICIEVGEAIDAATYDLARERFDLDEASLPDSKRTAQR
jgi:hypothetical protein